MNRIKIIILYEIYYFVHRGICGNIRLNFFVISFTEEIKTLMFDLVRINLTVTCKLS
jgi:hypothetical protein